MGFYSDKGILILMRDDDICATRKVIDQANPMNLGMFLKKHCVIYHDFIWLCHGVMDYPSIDFSSPSLLHDPRIVNSSSGIPKTKTILNHCRLDGIDHLYARRNQQLYYQYLYLPNVKTDDFLEELKTAKKINL